VQKVVFFLIVAVMTTNCSVFKSLDQATNADLEAEKEKSVSELIKEKNLTDTSFYIKSMDIVFSKEDNAEKLVGSLRFEKPDKYLISLKSRSGIEVSRIFINKDSLYIVDRIKRKVFRGSVKYIKDKYGITLNMLAVLIGDFKGVCGREYNGSSKANSILYTCYVDEVSVNYEMDNEVKKVKSVRARDRYGRSLFTAEFGNFKRENKTIYPARINWSNFESRIKAEITIQKIEYPWTDKLEFSFGNRYEIIELL
jgi:hypothetical protein